MKLNKLKLFKEMAAKGMTGRQLAKQAGLSSTGISSILKRGSCSIPSAGKIANALDVELEEIVAKEELEWME